MIDLVKFARDAARAKKKARPSPMRRLLESGSPTSTVQVDNASHWQTRFKAERLGLIDADGCLTAAGSAYLAKLQAGTCEALGDSSENANSCTNRLPRL